MLKFYFIFVHISFGIISAAKWNRNTHNFRNGDDVAIVNDISESMSESPNEASQKKGFEQMNKIDRDYDHDKWELYKRKYGKFYANEADENEHMMAFFNNLHYIIKHNKLYQEGNVSFKLGINHLSDLLPHEYKKLNGFRYNPNPLRNCTKFREPMNVGDLPVSVDWRTKGFVTPVKNQGMCGSCWAFSATGALEGQHKYATGELVSLSEQNLIDCSSGFGNEGCGGGFMDSAFQYVKANKGIDTEASYPYKADDEKCHFKAEDVGATDMGCVDIPVNEDILKIAVATQGPISVAIDAGHESFHDYKKGIYYEADCSPRDLDHGVLVVGYGTDPKHGDYWIVKNSWSTKWGMDGYILMSRNKNNNCGIATAASYPLV